VEWKAISEYLWLHATFNDGFNSGTDPVVAAGVLGAAPATTITRGCRLCLYRPRRLQGPRRLAPGRRPDPRAPATDGRRILEHRPGLQAFVGFGGHYEQAKTGDGQTGGQFTVTPNSPIGLGTPKTITYDGFYEWTADALVKYKGFGFMAAIYGLEFRGSAIIVGPKKPVENLDNYGATIQAGYMIIPTNSNRSSVTSGSCPTPT